MARVQFDKTHETLKIYDIYSTSMFLSGTICSTLSVTTVFVSVPVKW